MPRSILSLDYVRVSYYSDTDPTALTVQMAFTDPGVDPVSGDWKSASWDPAVTASPYVARCLVGPSGAFTPTAKTYDVWVKVAGPSPTVPVDPCGAVTFV